MGILLLVLSFLLVVVPSHYGQTLQDKARAGEDDLSKQKYVLITDLKILDGEASKLNNPLAHAYAKTAIADAAWTLDQGWAKKLLLEAYKLTLPDEEARIKLRNVPVGADPVEAKSTDSEPGTVRNYVLGVASRDKTFFDQITEFAREQLGRVQAVKSFSTLAYSAIAVGEIEKAGTYILRAAEVDPTLGDNNWNILAIAMRDREAADKLIIKYIERLKTVSHTRNSAERVLSFLRTVLLPTRGYSLAFFGKQVPHAGNETVRAYLSYALESISKLEQRDPGSAAHLRAELLALWLPLQQYAPELRTPFLQLESVSRISGQDASLPVRPLDEVNQTAYEESRKKAFGAREPEDLADVLGMALAIEDFTEARRLLDLLPEGVLRTRWAETTNLQEAISLAGNENLAGAEQLARRLNNPSSILRIYPVIVNGCVAKKDTYCAASLVNEAVKRLKRIDDKSQLLRNLSEFAKVLVPVDEMLALEVFDELIYAANHSDIDARNGYPGFNINLFTTLAMKHENRVRQAANSLKDRLQRIAALTAIYKWKAKQMANL